MCHLILKQFHCSSSSSGTLLRSCQVGWEYRIHQLRLCWGVRLPNECPVVQSARVIEYTNWIAAEGQDIPNECPVAQSGGAIEYTDCISADG